MTETYKKIDHLKEDPPIPRQKFVCLSFLSPEGIRNCNVRGLKIRGVFEDEKEAQEYAKTLRNSDNDFHIYVGEVGKWLEWDPDPNTAKDQNYQNEELNELMKGYKDNLEKKNRMEAERKEDLLRKGANSEKHVKEDREGAQRDRMRKKLAEKQAANSGNKVEDNQLVSPEKSVVIDEALLAKEQEVLDKTNKVVEEKQNKVPNIDKELERMKDLYAKMQKK